MIANIRFWFAYEVPRLKEKVWTWIAWHLPKTLVMWCYIRLASHATCTKYQDKSPNEIGLLDALDSWK